MDARKCQGSLTSDPFEPCATYLDKVSWIREEAFDGAGDGTSDERSEGLLFSLWLLARLAAAAA